MINAEEIARSTPRLKALIFGSDGYHVSQGVSIEAASSVSDSYPSEVWHYTRKRLSSSPAPPGSILGMDLSPF
jgi:citrate lyase subunit beta / citryl-CoA lyase